MKFFNSLDMIAPLLAELSWQTVVDYITFDASRAVRTDMLVRYVVQLLLLCGSAFFSGSEHSD